MSPIAAGGPVGLAARTIPGLFASKPFDPLQDFTPISHLAFVPLSLAVPASVRARPTEEATLAAFPAGATPP